MNINDEDWGRLNCGLRHRWDEVLEEWVWDEGPNEGRPTYKHDGFCHHCDSVVCRGGPDPCLGFLPGVAHACCGHERDEPYVVFGGGPGESCRDRDNYVTLRGYDALWLFELFGRGPGKTQEG